MANLIKLLAVAQIEKPDGLWASLYNWFEGFIVNYGWTILVFTVFVKLIVLPLDFYNRYSTRKNTFIQKRLGKQVAKINEKFKNNRERANQEVSALYKKEGYNVMGTCLFTLANLIITIVVFFSFFNALRDISAYKMLDQYQQLEQTYVEAVQNGMSEQDSQQQVLQKYEDIKGNASWLWVKNIWRNDSGASVVPNYTELKKAVNNASDKKYKQYFNEESELFIAEEQYNKVMQPVIDANTGWNGYFILPIMAGVLAFVSQYLTERANKTKKEVKENIPDPTQQMQGTMKFMRFMLPTIMIIFALTNSASFGIYLIASSLIGIITNFLIGFVVNKMTKKEEDKYLAYLEKEAIYAKKHPQVKKPEMVNYKKVGDRLWTQ